MRQILLSTVLAASCCPAFAQPRAQDDGWGLTVGAGALLSPAYEGDDDSRLSLLPNIQVSYGDRFFASVQDGVGYRIIRDETLEAGPILRVKFSRNADGEQPFAVSGKDTTDLVGLGDVDTSIELGGFLSYAAGPVRLGVEARKAVTGHEGLVADVSARWSGRALLSGSPVIWSIGPRARFVDDAFNRAYFSVDASQSAASGLPMFDAGGGLHSWGVGASLILPLAADDAWSAIIVAGHDRLEGDAAANPLVRLRGTPDQSSIGVFLSYRYF